jgi:DNA-binding SARP family transcriptional activator
MNFAVLGSLEVHDANGHALDLTSRRQRRLLAALLVHAGSVVSDDRLADMVWDDEQPPEHGVRSLRTVVSRLRTALDSVDSGNQYLRTTPPGYLLDLNGSELDSVAFERHVERARRMLTNRDPAGAVAAFTEALSLWRGAAYAEFATEEWARAEAVRLEERRAEAIELRLEARLQNGAHREVVGELEQLVAVHPYRERPHVLLMLALYRSGRQADALKAHTSYRVMLADELGLEPSVEMQELEHKILRHDTDLDLTISAPQVKSYELLEQLGARSGGPASRRSIVTSPSK